MEGFFQNIWKCLQNMILIKRKPRAKTSSSQTKRENVHALRLHWVLSKKRPRFGRIFPMNRSQEPEVLFGYTTTDTTRSTFLRKHNDVAVASGVDVRMVHFRRVGRWSNFLFWEGHQPICCVSKSPDVSVRDGYISSKTRLIPCIYVCLLEIQI